MDEWMDGLNSRWGCSQYLLLQSKLPSIHARNSTGLKFRVATGGNCMAVENQCYGCYLTELYFLKRARKMVCTSTHMLVERLRIVQRASSEALS